MIKTTERLKTGLRYLLEQKPEILAVWEGGAIATGYLDEYSDLDLSIIIAEGNSSNIFAMLDKYFEKQYGILRRTRMPEPCWHGFSQCFYLLKDMPALFYCDIVVIKKDNPDKFTEPDRHGKVVIWFDKEGICITEETSPEVAIKRSGYFYNMATSTDWISIIEIKKALGRNNWLAAQRNYLQFINRHLAPLLNLEYRPSRVDFGMRYAERDYPQELVKRLDYLTRISSLEGIEERLPILLDMFYDYREKNKDLGG